MKSFVRSLITLLALGSGFFLGFYAGMEKEKAKIPKFQDE
jgi:hypothetical protein